ncbi:MULTISPECIES: 1-deoxy-D-xylulose-5-phosphate reductoisomerase [Fictibacillus]|uniref:1-deoxy-D-xylulose 5-phosphate reductoisomerase n=1 Tax=Fictibacillus enclensis TaxID=1017270 RepID=A0A0V8JDN4_9BACL|nr:MULTISPECIES: 1-deoxy-D-xylulose-5-phosphate reductoisomerase [Fictibacillus]KSU85097.1 1-deoxy-D-xylulose 5-phosphate reductoisomerase [Fictibacillus enclensis]RXY99244.1 1-deoxy-D-xylulose-5-phosphate reductoisomerase [Fictibacillus sp. S7]SCB90891.1 1-deoxy-D-xylulose 5-phosphate reductoisomerase [Fictibacillus enclensis]
MKNISLLGATGSIGIQTLDVIAQHPELFRLTAISFGKNVEKGMEIIEKFKPRIIAVQDKKDADDLRLRLGDQSLVYYGQEGLIEAAVAREAHILVNAVMGSVGLVPTINAIQAGKDIAIANKETLVTAGHIIMELAEKHNVSLLPVDSEHSAIFQCLNGENAQQVDRLILTASGGSFRDYTREQLADVTVDEALNHPNWSMGAKITIDSATMMNKGLEVIEAHWLFNMPYSKIDVILHKESIIHSMVEYKDGSTLAHLGNPDMRVPIQYALTYPDRLEHTPSKRLNLWEIGKLHFKKMDMERFRCLKLAYLAGEKGGTMTTALNAANEAAVGLFLERKISFLAIEEYIEKALEHHEFIEQPTLEEIQAIDTHTRQYVQSLLN